MKRKFEEVIITEELTKQKLFEIFERLDDALENNIQNYKSGDYYKRLPDVWRIPIDEIIRSIEIEEIIVCYNNEEIIYNRSSLGSWVLLHLLDNIRHGSMKIFDTVIKVGGFPDSWKSEEKLNELKNLLPYDDVKNIPAFIFFSFLADIGCMGIDVKNIFSQHYIYIKPNHFNRLIYKDETEVLPGWYIGNDEKSISEISEIVTCEYLRIKILEFIKTFNLQIDCRMMSVSNIPIFRLESTMIDISFDRLLHINISIEISYSLHRPTSYSIKTHCLKRSAEIEELVYLIIDAYKAMCEFRDQYEYIDLRNISRIPQWESCSICKILKYHRDVVDCLTLNRFELHKDVASIIATYSRETYSIDDETDIRFTYFK